jgi:hypothetical protein
MVSDQMMALMAPITSSAGGTGPEAGHMPFRTYNGEVPMSEYTIPTQGSHQQAGRENASTNYTPRVWKLRPMRESPERWTAVRFRFIPLPPVSGADMLAEGKVQLHIQSQQLFKYPPISPSESWCLRPFSAARMIKK